MATYEEVEQMKREAFQDIKDQLARLKQNDSGNLEVMGFIFQAIKEAVDIAKNASDLTGPDKKKLVVENITQFYHDLDPDLPLVGGFLETRIEKFFLDHILPGIIEFLIKIYKEKNVW